MRQSHTAFSGPTPSPSRCPPDTVKSQHAHGRGVFLFWEISHTWLKKKKQYFCPWHSCPLGLALYFMIFIYFEELWPFTSRDTDTKWILMAPRLCSEWFEHSLSHYSEHCVWCSQGYRIASHFLSLRNQVGWLLTNKVGQKMELPKEEARVYMGSHHWATHVQSLNLVSGNVQGSMALPGSWVSEALSHQSRVSSHSQKPESNPLY